MFPRRIKDREKFAHGGDDKHRVAGFNPVDDAGAHFAVPLDCDLIMTAVEGRRAQGISPFVFGFMGPVDGDKLARFKLSLIASGPLESDCFNIGKFHLHRFDAHFSDNL